MNPAVVPASKLEDDAYDWWARHEEILRIKDTIDPEIVLIGDSITHFWGGEPKANLARGPKAFASVFAPYRVLNLGFGWDRTQNVLWRLDHGELDHLHPGVVVLNIGTNNTSATANARICTPEEIVEGIAAICGRLKVKVPDARLILMKLFPREEKPEHPRRILINATNRLLTLFAATCGVTLADVSAGMLMPDGTLPVTLAPDFCHPCEAGYQVWAECLRPLLSSSAS